MPWVKDYLAHVQHEKRLAERTVALYTADLQRLQQHAQAAGVSLAQTQRPLHLLLQLG